MRNIWKRAKSIISDHPPEKDAGLICSGPSDKESGEIKEEFSEITALMGEYLLPPPDERKIDQAVNALTQIMKGAGEERERPFPALARVLHLLSHVLQYSSKWYVAFCLLLYSAALLINSNSDNNPYASAVLLAPVPFLLAAAGAFRGCRAGMAELEMSFKYSFRQLIMAKLLLAALFNALCNVLLSLLLPAAGPGLDPVRLTFIWCAPFMLVSSVSLFIVIKIKGVYTSLACLGSWPALCIIVGSDPRWADFFTYQVKTELYAAVTFISFLVFAYNATAVLSRAIEGGDFFDTHSKKHIETIQG